MKRLAKHNPTIKPRWEKDDWQDEFESYYVRDLPWPGEVYVELELINPGESPQDWQITFVEDGMYPGMTDHPDVNANGMTGGFRSKAKALAAAKRIVNEQLPKTGKTPRIAKSKRGKLTQAQLKKYVEDWLNATEGPGGKLSYDANVYTGREWDARGEEFGRGAEVALSFEGPLYHALNYGFQEQPAFYTAERFREFLEALGYYYELGNAWNAGLYRI